MGGEAAAKEDKKNDTTSRFLLTKLKIVISCYQIFGFATLDLSSVTQTSCLLPWVDYIDGLIFSTAWPIVVLVLMLVAYNVVKRVRPDSAFADSNKWIYAAFLLMFLVFAGNSTYVFRYFNCIKFHAEGEDPSKIKVLMADMSINCRSDRYQDTAIYAWVMVVVYPIGFPLFCFFVLFRHRRQINPRARWKSTSRSGTSTRSCSASPSSSKSTSPGAGGTPSRSS